MEGLEFNVSHLLRESVGSSLNARVNIQTPLVLDNVKTSTISGAVLLIRTNFGILARARLRAGLALECDRCLDPFLTAVSSEFAEEFLPVIDVSTGRPVQSDRTDETFFISPNHIVDLTEAARQHLLLAIPMHRACKESCLGLCAICGSNRNVRDCGCTEEVDHPLYSMAALLKEAVKQS